MEQVRALIELVGVAIDVVGVTVIVGGAILAVALVATGRGRRPGQTRYRQLRQALGRAILLGLEFLVAADIIRTVAIEPTLESVTVLGGIVLIRVVLSFALEVEIDGRWPWQRGSAETDASIGA